MESTCPRNAAAVAREYTGATIAWGGGRSYDFDNPNPEIITIEDAAYALAYTVRWRGQTRSGGRRMFYGVGQHCVFGAQEMLLAGHGAANALAFLWHEPDEVVLPDFPGPGKLCVPDFKPFAKRQGEAFMARIGVPVPSPDLCKRWDLRMMVTEKRDLMRGHEGDYFQTSSRKVISDVEFAPFERRIIPYAHPDEAAEKFLELNHHLGGPTE